MFIALSVLALVMVAITLALFGLGSRLRRADELHALPNELLIIAAHPDDCVVLGGELGDEVARRGGTVRIAYITCGSVRADDERAIVRAKECVEAWRILGVGPETMIFLGIAESTTANPPPGASPEAIAEAQRRLTEVMSALGSSAHVLIPADAESNLDHRLSRKLALEAVLASGRKDLVLLESAEYNDFVSIVWTPGKAILRLLTALPLVARIARGRTTDPGGFKGGQALVLPPNEARMIRKLKALQAFTSENVANVLVRAFGRPDRVRKLQRIEAPRDLEPTLEGCTRFGVTLADASALWFWATFASLVILAGCVAMTLLSWFLPALSLAVSIALLVFATRSAIKHESPERRAFDLGIVVCAIVSALSALA